MNKLSLSVVLMASLQGCAYNTQTKGTLVEATSLNSNPAPSLATQEASIEQGYQPVTIKKVVRVGGWKLPDFSAFRVEKAQRARSVQAAGNGRTVQIHETELRPIQEVLIETEQMFLVAPDVVQIKPMTWLVESVTKFGVGKQTFCYVVRGSLVDIDEKNNVVSRLMTTANLNYYDENGTGDFTIFQYGTLSPVPRIPDWVIRRAKGDANP